MISRGEGQSRLQNDLRNYDVASGLDSAPSATICLKLLYEDGLMPIAHAGQRHVAPPLRIQNHGNCTFKTIKNPQNLMKKYFDRSTKLS